MRDGVHLALCKPFPPFGNPAVSLLLKHLLQHSNETFTSSTISDGLLFPIWHAPQAEAVDGFAKTAPFCHLRRR